MGFHQLLAPGSAGGIQSMWESLPLPPRVLGRGSGRLSACLSPSPCSVSSPPLEESGRVWVSASSGEGPNLWLLTLADGPRTLGVVGASPWPRPGQGRGVCGVLMPVPRPPLWLSTSFSFLLSLSQFIQQTPNTGPAGETFPAGHAWGRQGGPCVSIRGSHWRAATGVSRPEL